jgi:hypothetical protein
MSILGIFGVQLGAQQVVVGISLCDEREQQQGCRAAEVDEHIILRITKRR